MGEERVIAALDKMFAYSTTGRHPTASRFYTLKAMIQLGQRWQTPGEIMRQLKDLKINTNYVFEIAGRFPQLVEANEDKTMVRIQVEAYPIIFRLIDKYIDKIQSLKQSE